MQARRSRARLVVHIEALVLYGIVDVGVFRTYGALSQL